ncbi:MAG TPA: tyrosine-protein phosphatase [Solirubrobacteraceae bacterium]
MSTPGSLIELASVPNLRDIGGYATRGGRRVRTGVLYRSTELNKLSGDDLASFGRLGIRTVFDLRTADERTADPDRVPDGTRQIVCDVLADSKDTAPAQLTQVVADPAFAEELLGGGKAATLFKQAYREIVSLPSALAAYRQLFTDLLEDAHRPALFHCTTGKDRTGWAAAATLTLLGVSEDDVLADYMLTNTYLLPALRPYFDGFQAAGGDPDLLTPVLGVETVYLETALDEMRTRFGTIEGYFSDGLGIDAGTQERLRTILVA